jgi:hypothetical protein
MEWDASLKRKLAKSANTTFHFFRRILKGEVSGIREALISGQTKLPGF